MFPVAQKEENKFCFPVICTDSARYRGLSEIYDLVAMIYNSRTAALMGKCLIK